VQRTPSAVDVRNEHPTDEQWYKSQPAGWQMERIRNFTSVVGMEPITENLVDDGRTKPAYATMKKIRAGMTEAEIAALVEQADLEVGERVRARVDQVVQDKAIVMARNANVAMLINQDDPEYARIRKILEFAFRPSAVVK